MIKRKNYLLNASFFILGDSAAIVLASLFAYSLLASFAVTEIAFPETQVVLMLVFSILSLGAFKMYQVSWRFTSLRELLFISLGLASGLILSATTLLVADLFSTHYFLYLFLVYLLSILFVGGFRISKRMINEVLKSPFQKQRAILFGAGNAADQLLRDLTRNHSLSPNIMAIFDDDERLHGLTLHGVTIMGDRKKMLSYLRFNDIDELIIAIPSLPKSELSKITDDVHSVIANLKVKVLPSYHLLTDDPVAARNVRHIRIEDVLGREPARGDIKKLESLISGKKILITGAGGSIGSEIVRQCLHLMPKKITALDIDETSLFHLMNEYCHKADVLEPCVANVTDEHKLRQMFEQDVPDIIFHAAAYKHVPMMEKFPEEAVKINIGGTRLLSKMACDFGVKKFVLISTDKAVNPTNVMGATKRVAEEVCLSYNDLCGTKFMAVRFGNVLGSRGSVVPLFMEQIRNGGPLTITHKDIVRYFMTIPEAVLLVMHAGMLGTGGEIFVLDMGEPVKIADMAYQLIRLHGLEPEKDIAIEYTGLRPGEKMFEELLINEESLEPTSHKLIHKAICKKDHSRDEIEQLTNELLYKVQNGSAKQARTILQNIVPSYSFKIKGDYLIRESIG
ncbi:MAG: nucleoside-diphosphate sugar epimerase/dehydratase [Salibacteraceae bacterium]